MQTGLGYVTVPDRVYADVCVTTVEEGLRKAEVGRVSEKLNIQRHQECLPCSSWRDPWYLILTPYLLMD